METQKTDNLEDRVDDFDSKGFLKDLFLNFIPGYTVYSTYKDPSKRSRWGTLKDDLKCAALVELSKMLLYFSAAIKYYDHYVGF